MSRRIPELQKIDCDEQITKETHYEFLHHLQSALLLALRERGRLNAMQYRHAQEKLNSQRRERARGILDIGDRP